MENHRGGNRGVISPAVRRCCIWKKEFRRFFGDKMKTAALELNHRHDIKLP